jgi:lambda family phage tail tape measure protein
LNGALSETQEKFTETEKLLQKISKAFEKATEQSTSLQDTLNSGVQQAMKATTDGLADMILGAKSAKDAFKDMARSIINDLARMFIQQQITQPLFSTIGGLFSPTGGATSGAPTNPILSGNGGGFTGLGARAGGVDGKGGFPAILHPNETVIDHTKGQGMGGAVAVTLNISTGVSQTVRAEIANLMPQITEATKGAVLEARQRGGSYSRGLAGI